MEDWSTQLMTYRGTMIPKRLLFADKIEEIKAVCWQCHKKATMLIKYKDGKAVSEGPQIEIGGNDTYVSVCRKCYSKEVSLK